ncbi:AfsR/SARP family transcriptional regulator [Deinococcus apachensis]|uniref:AfsR/SARP family transcriptional regulator n=1 Tax=Deinococcus apachensis TaxID=309886 RepID=UPI0003AB25B1|nr:transposase family protein [Deinococcus apachensis]
MSLEHAVSVIPRAQPSQRYRHTDTFEGFNPAHRRSTRPEAPAPQQNTGLPSLEVKLLGRPSLHWHRLPLELLPPKLQALLYYLVARGEVVDRSELEEIFWRPRSNNSLRQALHQLRRLPGAGTWLRAGHEVGVVACSDAATFGLAVQQGRWREALDLWRSAQPPAESRRAFLWGLELSSAPAFTDWLEVERTRLETLYFEALHHRALELEGAGRYDEALYLVRALLREDRLNESAYCTAMRIHYRQGQPEAAHAYLLRCREALLDELGVAPLEETLVLARTLKQAETALPLKSGNLRSALERIPDPRGRRGRRYPLSALLELVLLALLCGNRSLRDIIRFGEEHRDLLPGLGFPSQRGSPGRTALSDLLDQLDVHTLSEVLGEVGFLSMLGSVGCRQDLTAIRLLEAWSQEIRQTLALDGNSGWLSSFLERLGWSSLKHRVAVSDVGHLIVRAAWEPRTGERVAKPAQPNLLPPDSGGSHDHQRHPRLSRPEAARHPLGPDGRAGARSHGHN